MPLNNSIRNEVQQQSQEQAAETTEALAFANFKSDCDQLLMTAAGFDADVPPPLVDFVLPGLVRGDVGALIAAGGTGKSFFGLQLAYSLSSDLDITGGFFGSLPRRKVFYIAREDQISVLRQRKYNLRARLCAEAVRRQKADPAFNIADYITGTPDPYNFPKYNIGPKLLNDLNEGFIMLGAAGQVEKSGSIKGVSVNLTLNLWQKLIKQYVAEFDIDLIILDTLRMCHDLDENSGKDMAQLIDVMKNIAAESCCSIIFLHHVNKMSMFDGKSSEIAQASRGSSVLVDNIRWQINMGCMSESIAQRYEETNMGTKQKPQTPLIDRREITCIACTKINNGKSFDDATYKKDCYGALQRCDLTPVGGKKGSGSGSGWTAEEKAELIQEEF